MATSRSAPGRRSGMNRRKARKGRPMEGERLELAVEGVAHGGHCVARHEGRVVFVRHTLPGERVVARITEGTSESKFLRADAVEVLDASPDRVPAPCPFSGPGMCGGCDWQHVALPAQRALKTQVVREQLQRIAKIDLHEVAPDFTVEELPGHPDGLRWRTRLELAVDDGVVGLREHRSHRLVEIDDCVVSDEGFTAALRDRFDSSVAGLDLVRPSVGDIVGIELPQPKGEKTPAVREIVDTAHGSAEFDVSARGFWQVHPAAASTFLDVVLDATDPQEGERAVDLYCGVGLFTRALADLVGPSGSVLGVEADAEAIEYARTNMGGARHVDLLASDVAKANLGTGADVVVLDPPRAGAGRDVVATITDLAPRVVTYVACDPAALARDLGYFAERGYQVDALRGFDAFPMTQHVECIAVLRPRGEANAS